MRMGVIVNSMFSDFCVAFLKGVRQFCEKNNITEIIIPLSHGKNYGIYDYHCDSLLSMVSEENLDGLVICASSISSDPEFDKTVAQVKKLAIPCTVSVGLELEGIPSVMVDSTYAMKRIVRHLINDHGCRKFILMRACKGNFESDIREAIVRQIFKENNIEFDDSMILNGNFTFEFSFSAMAARYHGKKPDFDACICLSDNMAEGVISYLSESGYLVPEEYEVTGFDNIFESSLNNLDITTVDQRMEELAYLAAEEVFDMTAGKEVPPLKTINALPVFRTSCGCQKDDSRMLTMKEEEYLSVEHRKETTFVMEKARKRISGSQIYMLHYFLMESQSPLPLNSLYNRLEYCFALFDISSSCLVLFDHPVYYENGRTFQYPDIAELVLSITRTGGAVNPGLRFNPNKKILPEEFFDGLKGEYTVFPLYAESYQYGYIFLNFGRYERIFYQTVFELVAKEIINSIKLSHDEVEQQSLRSRNLSLEEYSEELHRLSFTDELTQIMNRRGFLTFGQRKIKECLEQGYSGLVIFGDMDGLKTINDTFGHDAGDRAIRYESQILKNIFRGTDIIGRLGGDEFAILAPNMRPKDFERIRGTLDSECRKINEKNLEPFVLSISVGFTEFNKDCSDLEKLLNSADKAQYEAKRARKAQTFRS